MIEFNANELTYILTKASKWDEIYQENLLSMSKVTWTDPAYQHLSNNKKKAVYDENY